MGLRAAFNVVDDLGYPDSTPELGLFIDYSEGCEVFVETFLQVATDLVPVDTGHLRGSIKASYSGDDVECITRCEYAQYVEYGTIRMGEQPYFEPAIEAALGEAFPIWNEAVDEAMEEEEELLEEMEEAEEEASSRGGRGGSFFLGAVGGGILAGIIMGFFNIFMDMLFGNDGGRSGSVREGGGDIEYGWGSIDVEII